MRPYAALLALAPTLVAPMAGAGPKRQATPIAKANPADRDKAQKAEVAKVVGREAPSGRRGRTAAVERVRCVRPAVEVVHGTESLTFPLMTCDGRIAPLAIERLSEIARAGRLAIRPVDPGLVVRLQELATHLKKGEHAKFEVISGYRPGSRGSLHASARALDVRLDGVANETLLAFCKKLPDTGCGYYPNSTFIHIDVRNSGAGHVSWIDISGPGEAPRYVSTWPPKPGEERSEEPLVPTELFPKQLDESGHALPIEELQPFDVDRTFETTEMSSSVRPEPLFPEGYPTKVDSAVLH